jgi:hypothetical protein
MEGLYTQNPVQRINECHGDISPLETIPNPVAVPITSGWTTEHSQSSDLHTGEQRNSVSRL